MLATGRMAPTNLNTVSNDVLLVIIDWLESIIAVQNELQRQQGTILENMRREKERRSLISLSRVNRHFRTLVAPSIFRKLSVRGLYEKSQMDHLMEALKSVHVLAAYMK